MKIPEAPYNYCDYRCEKCSWTEHCKVYQDEQTERLLLEAEGIDPDTWEGTLKVVERNFWKVRDMLEKDAERFDIDLTDLPQSIPEPPETALEKQAHDCAMRLHKISEKISESEEFVQLQEILDEAYQDLLWNEFLFSVKLQRAMHGLWEYENEDAADFRDASLLDGLKSAEVSIRSIETNREALAVLADKIPPLAAKIRQEIRELEEIQAALETEIQKYRGKDSSWE